MPNPLVLLGASTMPQRHSTPHEQKIISGKVNRVEGGKVFAIIDTFARAFEFGPLEVPAGWTPEVGETCLIAFDQHNTGYVIWHK